LEQVWRHYVVEKDIAQRLKDSDARQRKAILSTMYDELFAKVPDHPRLTRRVSAEMTGSANRAKEAFFARFLTADCVALEFAPGDCCFAEMMAPRVKKLFGLDISDQREQGRPWPENFELVIYDGQSVEGIDAGSIDVVYSDQLLEHLHPDDAAAHLRLVRSLLRPGGCYVIVTPHAVTGPWDVSRYFSDVPEGFHLKEWTYAELEGYLTDAGYSRLKALYKKKMFVFTVPMPIYRLIERFLDSLPRRFARRAARYLAPTVYCVAYK
jgi:SAM-dependent methyltransferase